MSEISLRDYFAAAAMQGLLAVRKSEDESYIASLAYMYADAMLKRKDNEF